LIKVEGHLFKVPARNFTIESEVFETMFKLPQNPNIAVDGCSDDQPLRLEGVKREDFRQLLRVMYARYEKDRNRARFPLSKTFKHHSGIEKESLTLEQWISVLELSTQWAMENIRALAIRNIGVALPPDDVPHRLLTLGQRYGVDMWVIGAVDFLIKREQPMGRNDVESIGLENVLKIASLRECCIPVQTFTRVLGSNCWSTEKRGQLVGNLAGTSVMKLIEELFGVTTT